MLKHYDSSDFKILESWVTDEALLIQFSGTGFTFPLTAQQITDYQVLHPDRKFYMGYNKERIPFAFGEIIPQESGHPRLARILVGNPASRGQRLGRYFIQLLLEEIRIHHHSPIVELYVWEKNAAAIKCYQSVGFIYLPEREMILVHNGIDYHIHKMVYTSSEE